MLYITFVRYYHLVFTLPHELNAWCQLHPEAMYSLLFKAVWKTLEQFSKHHKRLRGQLGLTSVLHTWGQTLQQHIHIHCLIPGLALKSDHKTIETTQSDYLYPVNALKKVFRGQLVSLLRKAYQQGDISLNIPIILPSVINGSLRSMINRLFFTGRIIPIITAIKS